jgi:2-polyprenyl-3-methyl-5-hydroxy-6-metoxy-1,4-benzoquinol methylase
MIKEYYKANKQWWNSRVDAHYKSPFYDVDSFMEGKSSLNQPELDYLGDIRNKSVLHLQCHFGMDSISLERLGANVTAIDFSNLAIDKANELKNKLNSKVRFVCCDVNDVHDVLQEEFDIVFTSYGTIIWLSNLNNWAKQINLSLKPNGNFIFADFHPVIWMFNDEVTKPIYPYSSLEAIVLDESESYAQKGEQFASKNITWNHSISDTFNALKQNGLTLDEFHEYLEAPYPFLSHCIKSKKGFSIKGLEGILPLMYSIKCTKKSY